MSKRLAFERYLWFHQKLKTNRYPTLRMLMDRFEISHRQAERELQNMREFFNAPIKYSKLEEGYYYTDDSFEFPYPMISQEDIISLILEKRLSVTIPDKQRKNKIQSLYDSLYCFFDLNVKNLEKKVSLKNIRYYRVKPDIFNSILLALFNEKKIKITYRSVFKKETTVRMINPLHLILYMGNWHIVAFCERRNEIRDFSLSRIKQVQKLDENIQSKIKSMDIKGFMDNTYGIFLHGKKTRVILKFNREISEFVMEQVWFPGQKIKLTSDGSVILSFHVMDLRELTREILSFGPEVEVMDPKELRTLIKQKIGKMGDIYSKG